jgi:hypothetical protein
VTERASARGGRSKETGIEVTTQFTFARPRTRSFAPDEPAGAHSSLNRAVVQPEFVQLRAADDAMLPRRENRNPRVARGLVEF